MLTRKKWMILFAVIGLIFSIGTSSVAATDQGVVENDVLIDSVGMADEIFALIDSPSAISKNNKVPVNVLDPSITPIRLDQVPYVPFYFVAECYEIPVTWNADDLSAKVEVNGNKIVVRADSDQIVFNNDKQIRAPHPPKLIDNVFYVSLDTIEKVFGKYSEVYDDGLLVIGNQGILEPGYKEAIQSRLPYIINGLINGDDSYKEEALAGKGISLVANDALFDPNSKLNTTAYGESKVVPISDQPFQRALELDTQKQPANSWDYQFVIPTTADSKTDDWVLITFYARATRSTDESGTASMEAVVEQKNKPWFKSVISSQTINGEWTKIYIPFRGLINHPAGDTNVIIRLGYKPQTIQIADLKVMNYGAEVHFNDLPNTEAVYTGREQDAQWRKEALADINESRKKNVKVEVVDPSGNPVKDALVNIKMDDQLMNLGTMVNQWYITEWPNVIKTPKDAEDARMLKETLVNYFNTSVLGNGLKWNYWEDGRKANSRLAMSTLKEMGLRVRGHALYWDAAHFVPSNLQPIAKSDPDQFRTLVTDHIKRMAEEFRGSVTDWDVLNEPTGSRTYLLANYGESVIKEWFAAARQSDPIAKLYVNETAITGFDNAQYQKFAQIVQGMIANGVDFDGVGLQGHFPTKPAGPEAFLKQIDAFAKMGKSVQVTEYDLDSADEDFQADFLRDQLIASFSNPSVKGFIMWGYWDADHEKKKSPMFRADWSMKPSAQMWYRLWKYAWNTNVEGFTNEAGEFTAPAYEGHYTISVNVNGVIKQVKEIVDADKTIRIVVE